MIKVGDKLLIKGEVYIIQNESYNDNKVGAKCVSELKFVEMEFDTALGYAFAYEKQRADRVEKRWEKLKEHFIKEKEQSFGILSWSRNNGMLELMHDLEEGGE